MRRGTKSSSRRCCWRSSTHQGPPLRAQRRNDPRTPMRAGPVEEVIHQIFEHHGSAVGWSSISYLPFAHVAERLFSHYFALTGVISVTFVRDVARMSEMLTDVRPYLFFGTAEGCLGEDLQLHPGPDGDRRRTRSLGCWVPVRCRVAQAVGQAKFGHRAASLMTRMLYPIMKPARLLKLRPALGLRPGDDSRDHRDGVALVRGDELLCRNRYHRPLEIYGPTESGVVTMSPLDAPRLGTVGRAMRGVGLKIETDGEILVKSPAVSPGWPCAGQGSRAENDRCRWVVSHR